MKEQFTDLQDLIDEEMKLDKIITNFKISNQKQKKNIIKVLRVRKVTKSFIENVPKYPEFKNDEKFTICFTCHLEGKPYECHLNCQLNEFIKKDNDD